MSRDLTIECLAQQVHDLTRERNEWRREAELQHACGEAAYSDARDLAYQLEQTKLALERALDREERYRSLLQVRVRLAVPAWPEGRIHAGAATNRRLTLDELEAAHRRQSATEAHVH